jgi:tRNA(Ile)-lysidine synthetase-like protein
MIAPGDTLLVAVSGGPDSLCLLHVLAQLRDDLGFALHVAHLNHMLRGDESLAEAAFVAAIASAWHLPATISSADVYAQAQQTHANLHQAARIARYTFLAQTAQQLAAQSVAVAHQANDQAETVLMHMLRGAGTAGLRGMRPVVPWAEWAHDQAQDVQQGHSSAPALIRPLLPITRSEIAQYCAAHGLQPRCDPTNTDTQFTRNRIRHELLPQLADYNPQIVAALGRSAVVCADEQAFIQQALATVWPTLAHQRAGAIDFAGESWRSLHPALQRAALRQAHMLLRADQTLGLEHVEAARAAVNRGVGRRVELPGGLALTVGYGGSFTIGALLEPAGPQLMQETIALPVPGRIALERGWTLSASYLPAPVPARPDVWQVAIDGGALPLVVRRRRPGDRLHPAGGRGRRRLQDLFIDAKVPRTLRSAWPLVATATMIVWVPGVCAAEPFVARPDTAQIVHMWITPAMGEQQRPVGSSDQSNPRTS